MKPKPVHAVASVMLLAVLGLAACTSPMGPQGNQGLTGDNQSWGSIKHNPDGSIAAQQ